MGPILFGVAYLECVPNISEGRRVEVIDELSDGFASARGVLLADVSSDVDHNRTVFTLFGDPAALSEALFVFHETALRSVDLGRHRGVHPRIGVVDVTPFVALTADDRNRAIAVARTFGKRVGGELGVPVFLYSMAARAGGLQVPAALRSLSASEIASRLAKGSLQPDFGPRFWDESVGVALIGARGPLIAFNLLLETSEVAVARSIARTVRESGDGLPGVQALGVGLESRGCAQVSTNVLDFQSTSIYELHEAVCAEAAALGTAVVSTELVGLLPRAALEQGDVESLRLEDFDETKIIETHLGKL